MPALSYYSNVQNTALNLIAGRGYQIWHDPSNHHYCAEKDGWDFMANEPVQLLGLISIFETLDPSEYREYWWRIREPRLYDSLANSPKDFTPVYQRRKPLE